MSAEGVANGSVNAGWGEAVDQIPAIIWSMGAAGECLGVNAAWSVFSGHPPAAALGAGLAQGVHPDDAARCSEVHARALAEARPFRLEYRMRRADGTWRRVLANGQPVQDPTHPTRFVVAVTDVTELEVPRLERDTLLSELQHRVKNNAQATTSFLALQANRASDPAVTAALRAAATRVMLATLVQDRMFRVEPGARVDLGTELATTAMSAMEMAGRPGLRLETAVEPGITLPVARAMPLGLIVNELVVNAARHAFPNRPEGTVRLTVRCPTMAAVEILVADDGVGLPPTQVRNTPHGALGLHLVPRLARQAGARFQVENGGGTRCALTLPIAS